MKRTINRQNNPLRAIVQIWQKIVQFVRARRWLCAVLHIVALCLAICTVATVFINAYVTESTENRIITIEQTAQLDNIDCVLVLGCSVRESGEPSAMLSDRLTVGLGVYEIGATPKMLMSGDHGRADYDEVDTMKQYAIRAGVPSAAVFMDHAGFSTYESLYRAKEIFGVKRIVIVTQRYHLYRALFIAKSLGMEAWGVAADLREYRGQQKRDLREVAARVKDFGYTIYKPEPTYLGKPIPITGDGDITND